MAAGLRKDISTIWSSRPIWSSCRSCPPPRSYASVAFLEKLDSVKSFRKTQGVAIVGNACATAPARLPRPFPDRDRPYGDARLRDSQATAMRRSAFSIFEMKGLRAVIREDWQPLIDYMSTACFNLPCADERIFDHRRATDRSGVLDG